MSIGCKLISGREVAESIIDQVKAHTVALSANGITPGLAVIIVGSDPASQVYVASKGRKAEECGFLSIKHELPHDVPERRLLELIDSLNADPSIHGILVQLPLPRHVDSGKVIQAISPQKDIDGFHFINVGKLGTGALETAFVPCTPAGCMILVERIHGKDLSGLSAVVVGRSNIVGKPMANLLLAANATVTIAHSRTANLEVLCRQADILIAAVGRPEMIRSDWIKPGATVIDVGINRIASRDDGGKTRLVGDVDFDGAVERAGAVTPVPGGVGPMTIAMLMANTLRAACHANDEPAPHFGSGGVLR
ncbi:bifunctional methylenetetrahydrofolate dehydrogenase/methenyltetrahydrofolate cyclohydrolase FolD [Sinorhizobium fredii]|uniref:Bifunctional protein FolD n=1 Tax=Sinorhizobium fredii (strain NBRC 101917 / NGR234) TaxID=394 RepID=FOLD_SINFN|nr:bifunctional methylenetetrahydrofolate dehydrogenase/methenyltetrahydrofolate cyclohydrolase FolD [Sinorhizobium fredii]Q6W210.1 RecName: Full=Bifunctional protein FolD; Includes: RecName: Full=Methylenetetrahydrofolate dehydrogenase; Includes: RecName: Full=Methenyltetrahydrofolate cyclohydrolase [Sinorhizobium fredii NGR234]AAQ87208.1 Methylenetetrahydrofolate dehydrogenase (NADP+) / Methenyltetrahydrofolate cyclohydrolase [Sinorhizobium fredii NGR234]